MGPGLATGAHSFAVRASNGNGTSAATTRNWTVTAAPVNVTYTGSDTTNLADLNDGDTRYGWINQSGSLSSTRTNRDIAAPAGGIHITRFRVTLNNDTNRYSFFINVNGTNVASLRVAPAHHTISA